MIHISKRTVPMKNSTNSSKFLASLLALIRFVLTIALITLFLFFLKTLY